MLRGFRKNNLLILFPDRLTLVQIYRVFENLYRAVKGVGGENSFNGEAVLGGVGPVLIEDEVAERVDDRRAVVDFGGLRNVRMVTDDETGPGVDEEMGELLLAR